MSPSETDLSELERREIYQLATKNTGRIKAHANGHTWRWNVHYMPRDRWYCVTADYDSKQALLGYEVRNVDDAK